MRDELVRALDFAIVKEKEAEAFYKEWAAKVQDPGAKALLAELAGTEHGHAEMLSRVTPEEAIGRAANEPTYGLSELLVGVEASAAMSVQEAMIVAMKREERAVLLYERLARLGGEAKPLFAALAKEEAKHKRRLEAGYDEAVLTEN